MAAKTAKTVKVCCNGNTIKPAQKVTLQAYIKSIEQVCDKVTRDLRMPTCCRTLCTPIHGHPVVGFDDIQSGSLYVATGTEKFKQGDYGNIKGPVKHPNVEKECPCPVAHGNRRLQLLSGRAKKRAEAEKTNNIYILVNRNGDDKEPAKRIHLSNRELQSIGKVCDYVNTKVELHTGAVSRLYTLKGKQIKDSSELKGEDQYVAAGRDKKFKDVAYILAGAQNCTPRSQATKRHDLKKKRHPVKKTTPNRTKKTHRQSQGSDHYDRKLSSTTDSNKESSILSPRSNPSSNKRDTRDSPPPSKRDSPPDKKRESLVNNKRDSPRDDPSPIEELPVEAEEQVVLGDKGVTPVESVYEASGELQEKAREVLDDKGIVEDKPIDLVPAEEVTDEEIEAPIDTNEIREERQQVKETIEDVVEDFQGYENQEIPEMLENSRERAKQTAVDLFEDKENETQEVPEELEKLQELENQEKPDEPTN